jgi:hypothetical protein
LIERGLRPITRPLSASAIASGAPDARCLVGIRRGFSPGRSAGPAARAAGPRAPGAFSSLRARRRKAIAPRRRQLRARLGIHQPNQRLAGEHLSLTLTSTCVITPMTALRS